MVFLLLTCSNALRVVVGPCQKDLKSVAFFLTQCSHISTSRKQYNHRIHSHYPHGSIRQGAQVLSLAMGSRGYLEGQYNLNHQVLKISSLILE
jgi:hypothetical protein